MSYGNIQLRPDLAPMFPGMAHEEAEKLLDALAAVDERMARLAEEATAHVGLAYKHMGLGLFVREDDAEIAGGPFGQAGDLWFEVRYTEDETHNLRVPPWEVDSQIIIYCADNQQLGVACTHRPTRLLEHTYSPFETVSALSRHVEAIAASVIARERRRFTDSLHAELPE